MNYIPGRFQVLAFASLLAMYASAGVASAQAPASPEKPPAAPAAPEKPAKKKPAKAKPAQEKPETEPKAKDGVTSVADDDAEMAAAIAKARKTLPDFWKVFEDPKQGETRFALKVAIRDENGAEHFWVNELERKGGKVFGEVNNDPNTVKSVKLGQRIEIPPADVSDWTYTRDGKMHGNFTLRALFKHIPPKDVEALKKLLADP